MIRLIESRCKVAKKQRRGIDVHAGYLIYQTLVVGQTSLEPPGVYGAVRRAALVVCDLTQGIWLAVAVGALPGPHGQGHGKAANIHYVARLITT